MDNLKHPDTMEELPPSFLLNIWDQGTGLIEAYGWYFFILALIVVYYWQTLQSLLDEWYIKKSEKEYDAKCKKDPDWLQRKQLEMDAARKKMQEEMDMKAALHISKINEKKRAELSASSAGGEEKTSIGETSSPISQSKTSSTAKKSFRPEYNPLMGSGGSGGWRPTRRGCPGGGCG